MNALQDMLGGWRARPLNTLATALLAFGLSVLIATGLWLLHQAEQEAAELLRQWPEDECTLLLPPEMEFTTLTGLLNRLPPGKWMGISIHNRSAWVSGTLPGDFFHGRGNTLPPEVIARGENAVLLQKEVAGDLQPGSVYLTEDQAYRVYGIGGFSYPVEQVFPARARELHPPSPQQIRVQVPADVLTRSLADTLLDPEIQLVDHQQQQHQARKGFRRLRKNFSGVAVASALLTALLLQALARAEVRERKSEFALRRSLGARPVDIRNQLLMETLINSALPSLAGSMIFLSLVPFGTLAVAWALTLVWILLCASFPALQAARLSPGEALKGE